jgi:hypothetical protein
MKLTKMQDKLNAETSIRMELINAFTKDFGRNPNDIERMSIEAKMRKEYKNRVKNAKI